MSARGQAQPSGGGRVRVFFDLDESLNTELAKLAIERRKSKRELISEIVSAELQRTSTANNAPPRKSKRTKRA